MPFPLQDDSSVNLTSDDPQGGGIYIGGNLLSTDLPVTVGPSVFPYSVIFWVHSSYLLAFVSGALLWLLL